MAIEHFELVDAASIAVLKGSNIIIGMACLSISNYLSLYLLLISQACNHVNCCMIQKMQCDYGALTA